MSADEPSMSHEPDIVDEMSSAEGWAKDMRVMTPEQRERTASLELPRVDESLERSDPSSRADAAAGAARVALAKQIARDHHLVGTSMYDTACSCGGWPTLDGPPHHVEHVALAVMAVADEERAADWAEIERLRAAELDAAAHRHCLEAIAASPAPEATTSEGIYWLTEKLANARRDTWADVAATLNDRAVMWEQEGRRVLAEECKGMANACRTYAEGVGVPSVDSLRRKRREAEARLDALVADLRGLADKPSQPGRWVLPDDEDAPGEWVTDLRAVLDKHAGEQPGVFERLLADPTEQFDTDGVGLATLQGGTVLSQVQAEAYLSGECGHPIEEPVTTATASAAPSKPMTWIADLCGLPKDHDGDHVKRGDLDKHAGGSHD